MALPERCSGAKANGRWVRVYVYEDAKELGHRRKNARAKSHVDSLSARKLRHGGVLQDGQQHQQLRKTFWPSLEVKGPMEAWGSTVVRGIPLADWNLDEVGERGGVRGRHEMDRQAGRQAENV